MSGRAFAPLPTPLTAEGRPRRTGVEIELGGLSEAQVAEICAGHLGGTAAQKDSAIWAVTGTPLGPLKVYLDTALREADKTALRDAALKLGREVIPVEIVTEPLDRDGLIALDGLRAALRAAGAVGSGGGLFFGFGVHLNIEIASDAAADVVRPLLSYALLEDWLREANPIDQTRRVLPFTAPYATALVRALIVLGPEAGLPAVMDAYLEHAASRNHGLDMLPIFAHLHPDMIAPALSEATTARPAFHFRLPDCRIDAADWSLDHEWRRWRTVERVAARPALLSELATAWTEEHGPVTLTRGHWARAAGALLAHHDLDDAGS
ncbi:amidoligase family protein [Roseovarius aestuariivivens]|uniref:amidoligase family protein n=1 Tax=Roseovarius aestuariivivens TaxID=1888910 RepID=UPI001081FCC2|nr:amidoligase family protein [Roseovarius aestuariivivens]